MTSKVAAAWAQHRIENRITDDDPALSRLFTAGWYACCDARIDENRVLNASHLRAAPRTDEDPDDAHLVWHR